MVSAYELGSIWRYPVKSMAGEELDTVDVSARGLTGDRGYALMDPSTRKVASAKTVKRFGNLLKCRAEFTVPPAADSALPPVRITLFDGTVVTSDQPDAAEQLGTAFGPPVSLISTAPDGLLLEFPAGTIGGEHAQTTEFPLSSASPAGTLFDLSPVHLLTTASLRALEAAYPEGRFAVERFRPNLVVDCGDDSGFVENAWVDRTVAVGPDLLLRVTLPCPRCVMTTLPRADLPHDPGILRTAAEENRLDLGEFGRLPAVGVYAEVARPGLVRRGDAVRLVD